MKLDFSIGLFFIFYYFFTSRGTWPMTIAPQNPMLLELERTKPLKVPSPSPPLKKGTTGDCPLFIPKNYCNRGMSPSVPWSYIPVCPLPRPLFTKNFFPGSPETIDSFFSSNVSLPDDCLTTTWQLTENFLPIVCQLPDNCLTDARWLPDNSQMTA